MTTQFLLEKRDASARRVPADAVVYCWPEQAGSAANLTGTAVDAFIAQAVEAGRFAGKPGELMIIPSLGLMPEHQVVLLGVGARPLRTDRIREAGAKLARDDGRARIATAEVICREGWDDEAAGELLQAFTEGVLLGQYRIRSYARDAEESPQLREIRYRLQVDDRQEAELEARVQRGVWCAEATNYARDLTNLPGNKLTPAMLAEEARKLAEACGLDCDILDEERQRELGMGGLLAVGQGSVNPPRMIVLRYLGDPGSDEVIGFAGKGVTFDTGGISLKPGEKMEEMISDMGGAAVIMGMLQAVSRMRAKVNVVAVLAAAENMPSGAAFKPGDVITTLSGRTIEVLNTDAEGRVVLADAMTYAISLGATRLIDVATLTGAVLTIFADVATAAVTTDEPWLDSLLAAAKTADEKCWPLPAYPEYWEKLKSDVADLNNSPGKWGACITAGLFIGTFAEGLPWIHLDTGGTAWLWHETALDPKFGSGAMTRTLIEWASRGCR